MFNDGNLVPVLVDPVFLFVYSFIYYVKSIWLSGSNIENKKESTLRLEAPVASRVSHLG